MTEEIISRGHTCTYVQGVLWYGVKTELLGGINTNFSQTETMPCLIAYWINSGLVRIPRASIKRYL